MDQKAFYDPRNKLTSTNHPPAIHSKQYFSFHSISISHQRHLSTRRPQTSLRNWVFQNPLAKPSRWNHAWGCRGHRFKVHFESFGGIGGMEEWVLEVRENEREFGSTELVQVHKLQSLRQIKENKFRKLNKNNWIVPFFGVAPGDERQREGILHSRPRSSCVWSINTYK